MRTKLKQLRTLKEKILSIKNDEEDMSEVISKFTDEDLKEIIDIMESTGEYSTEANLYWNKVMDRLGEKRYYAKIE
ncbi:hypothetical protein F8154_10295 [Alkaliphilus pronyensis]|uniref:Uncharacterized protein n=1 Tax=Alkaliphilus pronyensis TaxID=1482732 RepID=A0A6I0F3U6_9FIRM|nr:hypothetical protein [Alkaliphilus pronyensis]KAB3533849.1 hypothetical protein F8154_10295 [Alkaliphilus pronyensis]